MMIFRSSNMTSAKAILSARYRLRSSTFSMRLKGVCKFTQKVEELDTHCVFGGRAIVPDIAVFRWERIPRLASGRVANRFEIYPDWAIEILSPDQRYKHVLGKLLHCAKYGSEIGWLIDAEDENILVVDSDRRVIELKDSDRLPVLSGIDLELTVQQVFSLLSL